MKIGFSFRVTFSLPEDKPTRRWARFENVASTVNSEAWISSIPIFLHFSLDNKYQVD
jgi:hypothetical protein